MLGAPIPLIRVRIISLSRKLPSGKWVTSGWNERSMWQDGIVWCWIGCFLALRMTGDTPEEPPYASIRVVDRSLGDFQNLVLKVHLIYGESRCYYLIVSFICICICMRNKRSHVT